MLKVQAIHNPLKHLTYFLARVGVAADDDVVVVAVVDADNLYLEYRNLLYFYWIMVLLIQLSIMLLMIHGGNVATTMMMNYYNNSNYFYRYNIVTESHFVVHVDSVADYAVAAVVVVGNVVVVDVDDWDVDVIAVHCDSDANYCLRM